VLTVATLFRQQLQLLALRFARGHVVICGLGEKGLLLIRAFLRRGQRVVVIERDAANPHLTLCRQEGATAIVGDATKSRVLRKASVGSARYLIAVCGDDGANVAVALASRDLARGRRRGALTGAVHVASPTLTEMLRETELGAEPVPAFRLEIFSVADRAARELLREHSPLGPAGPPVEEAPSILVVGLGAIGRSLIAQAGERWYQEPDRGSERLRVTAVDVDVGETNDALHGRYARLAECCDLVGWDTEPETLTGLAGPGLEHWHERAPFDTVVVCLDDPSLALEVALALRRQSGAEDAPIVVPMPEEGGLVRLLRQYRGPAVSLQAIHPFDPLARTCTPDLVLDGTHELLARAVHEHYLRKRLEEGKRIEDERALVPWDALPEDLKESNRRQVDHIRAKLSEVGYTIGPLVDWEAASFRFSSAEVARLARMEHDRWLAERRRNKWRYAPGPKDPDRKTHPDLVPWAELSEEAKDKDREAVIELPVLLARGGFQLRPEPAEGQQTGDG
jgi:voltage-gated potassium channel Kch